MGHPIIQLRNVGVSFDDVVVHRDISFDIGSGEIVTILGPSGTGKTVLLKLMIGLLSPSEGEVIVLDKHLHLLSEPELREIRRHIGMLFQGAALFDSLTVSENVAYSLRERHELSEKAIMDVVEEKLSLVGLPEVAEKFPAELSGGQKKRVGLARALASKPEVMLFDEPTTGLDPTAKGLIDDLIMDLKKRFGITSVVVTHDIESAKKISDRWIFLSQGLVVADGLVGDLLNSPGPVERFVTGKWE